jgi:hypothetical protein
MSAVRLVVLFSILPLLLVPASTARATPGCDAPPDTAATEQYCETVAAPQGSTDVTQRASRPLAATLPKPVASRLKRAGVLGEVLLAMPTGDILLAASARPGTSRPPRSMEAREAAFDPRLKALRRGPGVTPLSVVNATSNAGASTFKVAFGWVLNVILVILAVFSLATRRLGRKNRI